MEYYGNNDWRDYIAHHGIEGQKWGVRNGPPYPLDSKISTGKRLKESSNDSASKKLSADEELKKEIAVFNKNANKYLNTNLKKDSKDFKTVVKEREVIEAFRIEAYRNESKLASARKKNVEFRREALDRVIDKYEQNIRDTEIKYLNEYLSQPEVKDLSFVKNVNSNHDSQKIARGNFRNRFYEYYRDDVSQRNVDARQREIARAKKQFRRTGDIESALRCLELDKD